MVAGNHLYPSIHQLQNYIVGVALGGFVLKPDGSLDLELQRREIVLAYFPQHGAGTAFHSIYRGSAVAGEVDKTQFLNNRTGSVPEDTGASNTKIPMNVIVLGATGMLGHKIFQVLRKRFLDTLCTIPSSINDEFLKRVELFREGNIIENVNADGFLSLQRYRWTCSRK